MSNTLDVTKVVCYSGNGNGSGAGYGMVTFNNAVTVKFNIMRSGKGELFVSWPSRKKATSDEYVHLVTFEDVTIRNNIQEAIIDEFNRSLSIGSAPKKDGGSSIKVVEDKETSTKKSSSNPVKWGNRK